MICSIYRPKYKPEIDLKEMLRYAGAGTAVDSDIREHAESAALMCQEKAQPACVYCICEVTTVADSYVILDGKYTLKGTTVAKYLSDCRAVLVVVATIGVLVDRMIRLADCRSSFAGLLADAAGSAAIEGLLDDFCSKISLQSYPKSRISPGYGDFLLSNQETIFSMLDVTKNIGVCLNDSLLMSPSKSVSAIVGCRQNFKNTFCAD